MCLSRRNVPYVSDQPLLLPRHLFCFSMKDFFGGITVESVASDLLVDFALDTFYCCLSRTYALTQSFDKAFFSIF